MKLKINHVPGYNAGEIVDVEVDEAGVPIDQAWRRRIKDAVIDQCVEVVKPARKTEEPKK